MVENFKAGDEVYYVRDTYEYLIIKATIQDSKIRYDEQLNIHFIGLINWDGKYTWEGNNFVHIGGSSGAVAEHCFWTLEEAKQYVFDEVDKRKNEYENFMNSKENVLFFPLKYSLCGEYGWDSERTNAYIKKVKEYFGIDLE